MSFVMWWRSKHYKRKGTSNSCHCKCYKFFYWSKQYDNFTNTYQSYGILRNFWNTSRTGRYLQGGGLVHWKSGKKKFHGPPPYFNIFPLALPPPQKIFPWPSPPLHALFKSGRNMAPVHNIKGSAWGAGVMILLCKYVNFWKVRYALR